jgi:hypothetical protein
MEIVKMHLRRALRVLLCAAAISAGFAATAEAACDQQQIYSVDTAHLEFGNGMIAIKAQGMAATAGWTGAQLLRLAANSDPRTVMYSFVACKPVVAAQVMSPVSAATVITANTATLAKIVIRSQTNTQTLDVTDQRRNEATAAPAGTTH